MITGVAVLAGAYLLGSIPFSFLVARYFGVADVRQVGSGNVGATNVTRVAGRPAGALAFVLDASKGAAAAWLTNRWTGGVILSSVAAAVAVLGHMYPVWLRFRGGKGVATGAGAFLPLAPFATVIGIAVFAIVALATRYVSIGSVSGAIALPLACLWLGAPSAVGWSSGFVALAIVVKHRSNLVRIWTGRERHLGGSA